MRIINGQCIFAIVTVVIAPIKYSLVQYNLQIWFDYLNLTRAKEQAQRSSLIGSKSIEHRQKYMDVNDK